MILDLFDREPIVVRQGMHWHWIAHIVLKHLAFLCSDRHLQRLSWLESDGRDLLAEHTLRQLKRVSLVFLILVPELDP